jgi:hypothetical protein
MKAAAQAYHLEALNEIKYVLVICSKNLMSRAFWTFVKSKDNNDVNALPTFAQRIYDACKLNYFHLHFNIRSNIHTKSNVFILIISLLNGYLVLRIQSF